MPHIISVAVEGPTDEVVACKLITHVGGEPGPVHGKKGKEHIKQHIKGYNNAARHAPWLVLVDLDHEEDCAPLLCLTWLPHPATGLCFRVVLRAIETWLLADAETLSIFLGVARSRIPDQPESLDDPKTTMVNLARKSRRRAIREDMVPREGSGRSVGPAYTSRLIEYVTAHWRPEAAVNRSDSLARAIRCLRRLVEESSN